MPPSSLKASPRPSSPTPSNMPRSPSLNRRCSPLSLSSPSSSTCSLPLPSLLLLLLLLLLSSSLFSFTLASSGCSTNCRTRITADVCLAPPPFIKKTTGADTEAVLTLCMKTNRGLAANFDNADVFFMGNGSSFRSFGVSCLDITPDNTYKVFYNGGNSSYSFLNGVRIPSQFALQSWQVPILPPYDPKLNQTFDLTISNNSPSNLQLTGLGAFSSAVVYVGNTSTVSLPRSQVDFSYSTLDVVNFFVLNTWNKVQGLSCLVFIQEPLYSNVSSITITYVLIQYDPTATSNAFRFLLHESTYYAAASAPPPPASRRRLLGTVAAPAPKAASGKTTAPAGACSGAQAKSSTSATCNSKTKNYPACASALKCGK